METIQISHYYRPLRIGYAVNFANKEQLLDAVERATLVAGGMYNPILPAGIEDALLKKLVRTFNVDVVENLTGSDIEFFKSKTHYHWPRFESGTTYDNGDSKDSPARIHVLDVSHKMHSIYDRPKRDADGNNCAIAVWDDDDPRALYFAFEFGKYPSLNRLDYTVGFEHFLETTRATIKKGDEVDPKLYGRYTPIHLTSEGLTLRSNIMGDSNRSGFYVGDSESQIDLVNFWNLRAAGYDIVFVENSTAGQAVVGQLVSDDAIPNITRTKDFASFWFREEMGHDNVTNFAKSHITSPYLIPIHAGYWTGSQAVEPHFERDKSLLAQLEQSYDRKQLVFQKPAPPIYKTDRFHFSQKIVSCIKPFSFHSENKRHMLDIPPVPELTDWASWQMTSRTTDLRLKRGQIDLLTDTHDGVERLALVHYDDFFTELFKVKGMDITKDPPGILADRLIDHMGGVDSCRVFKVRGVRELLSGMKVDESISWSTAIQRIQDKDEHGNRSFDDYKELYIQQREKGKLTPQECMDFLIKHKLMRAGYNLKCENCNLDFWVSLDQAKDYVECPYCYKTVHMALQVRTRGDIAFRRSGLFGKDNNLEGGVPVALTLMHLSRIGDRMSGSPYCTARKVKSKANGINCETDFISIGENRENKLEIVIGESKTHQEITQQDADNLLKVKRQLDGDGIKAYICFTKLAPFTADEIKLFKAMDADGACPILFTEKEIADYNLYFNFEDSELVVKHAFSCGDLVRNSRKLYLG